MKGVIIVAISYLLTFPFGGYAQGGCSDAQLLLSADTLMTNPGCDDCWYYFHSIGDSLVLNTHSSSGENLIYELYKADKKQCGGISAGSVLPFYTNEKGKSNEALINYAIEKGYCFCEHCLHKIDFQASDTLALNIGETYLLKVKTEQKSLHLKMQFRSVPEGVDPNNLASFENSAYAKGMVPIDLKVGAKYTLRNIYFHGGSTELLHRSMPELMRLKKFMEENGTVKIQVLGHVNGPYSKNNQEYQELSEGRAQAIRRFLMENGVNSVRIQIKGMGNTEMIYPDPASPQQNEMNRRVEIVILSV